MVITTEITSLRNFEAWSGGKDNLDAVIAAGKVEQLDFLIEELWFETPISETTLNDFLWFDLPEFYPEYMEKDEPEEQDEPEESED